MLETISDRKIGVSLNDSLVDHFIPQVVSATDYYPFGSQMPGRDTVLGENLYRYGFNGQEKLLEIDSNHTTAKFWEYDTRIGRRWNLDPKPTTGVSGYSTLEDNPIQYDDVKGDCATCPSNSPFGTWHTEKDVSGDTPLGGMVFAGKDATFNYVNIGDQKTPNWVAQSFQNKDGNFYSWNDKKQWYVDSKGKEYDQAWYHDITDWGFKMVGKPLSETAKNLLDGAPLKDTRLAFDLYQMKSGPYGGSPEGFVAGGIGNSLYQWGDDLFAGGHRTEQAFIGGWQFAADYSLGAGIRSTKTFDLLSFGEGWGPFGKDGLKLGNYRIDLLYRTPTAGEGSGTLISIKQEVQGGNKLRWEWGIKHGTEDEMFWHSTFRYNIGDNVYGGNKQYPWYAPFTFWNYKKSLTFRLN